ncbi:MAG: low temperature requirement protein A [Eubacterium sp.]|nr:low temperature requirement protein A [Eubacterium sp.]
MKFLLDKSEKKVEYIELIYDLIFVYLVGRNNELLHHVENGFVSPQTFLAYILCTLAIIQIWNFTMYYINMFGRNGWRDHVFLFINMYLMYFIGQSTRSDWQAYQTQYHVAWGLILANIGIQYAVEAGNHREDAATLAMIRQRCVTLFAEAALVFAAAASDGIRSVILTAAAILCGILLSAAAGRRYVTGYVDFAHLSERAMLYVVFTFGEMIIVLAAYFNGGGRFSWNTIYFSLMAFLIVTGLFLSYEIVYDHLIDRERADNGLLYTLVHIFIIFMLNNITAALEFMRKEEIALVPKLLMIVFSIIGYYVFLFCLSPYAKAGCRMTKGFVVKMLLLAAAFAVAMVALRNSMAANILVTVIFVYLTYGVLSMAKKATGTH